MKLGPLIPEVNILCVKLQDSRPTQSIFFVEKWHFFVSGVCIFSTRTLPPFQNFEVQTLGDESPIPPGFAPLLPNVGTPTVETPGTGNTVNYAR